MDHLPEIYIGFKKNFPQIFETYAKLAVSCNKGGPLDEKTREMVKLGIAIGLSSEGAIKSHTRRALALGVTAEGVRHAALMALTTAGFPTSIAAMKWVDEVLTNQ
jgi:alkylhydroperoxidase/carboxymuconolactone decarboxylase family protein YurZ